MDRCALFVDAGYALADGAMAVHGARRRDSVSWDHAGLLKLLAGLARDRTGLPVLRCYWYETAEGRRTPEHDALAEMPGLKLRLINAGPGRREGIENQLRRDLVTLAKSGAISDAFIASADEHVAEIVAEVQDLGLRVVILHIASDNGWTIPASLRQECDDIVEVSGGHLRPFVELIRGAEPAHDDQYAGMAPGSRGGADPNGAIAGALTNQGLPAEALPAPGAGYPVPGALGYRSGAQPYGSPAMAQGTSSATLAGQGASIQSGSQHDAQFQHRGGGSDRGAADQGPHSPAPPGSAVSGSASSPMAGSAVPADSQVLAGSPAAGNADGALGGGPQARYGPGGMADPSQSQPGVQAGTYQNGVSRGGTAQGGAGRAETAPAGSAQSGFASPGTGHGAGPQGSYQGGAGPIGPAGHGGRYQDAGSQNGAQAGYQPGGDGAGAGGAAQGGSGRGPAHGGSAAGAAGQSGYHSGREATVLNGPGGYQAGPGGYQNGPGQNGAAGGYQNGAAQGGPAQGGAMPGPMQPGGYQSGLVLNGAAPGGYQNGQSGPAGAGYQNGTMNGASSGGFQAPDQRPGMPMRNSAGFEPAAAHGQQVPYGNPDPGFYPAPPGPAAQQQSRVDFVPGHQHAQGPAFHPQEQYGAPAQPAAAPTVRVPQPAPISLPEAVKAAHAEGFSFGETVGRDAPGLWLEAVLARKPRMPSDLEARLLQGSVLPIDSLLHDEVRHSLRRGFWDALESARR